MNKVGMDAGCGRAITPFISFSFHFHFIFNSLNRVKASITKITALQLALSTKQKRLLKKIYLQVLCRS